MQEKSQNTPRQSGLDAVRALGEPTRRSLYEYVVGVGEWVGRDSAADALGIERANAAHHLDRLAADGLLEVDYQRISGRQGPGAGRPAKLYRRARTEIGVSLPPRDYEFAGRLLAEAAERSGNEGIDMAQALDQVADSEGHVLGEAIRETLERWDGQDLPAKRSAVLDALASHGFEPIDGGDGTVILRNCPFHQLAQHYPDLICGMNLCLLTATLEDLDGVGLEARLEPTEDCCCVRFHVAES